MFCPKHVLQCIAYTVHDVKAAEVYCRSLWESIANYLQWHHPVIWYTDSGFKIFNQANSSPVVNQRTTQAVSPLSVSSPRPHSTTPPRLTHPFFCPVDTIIAASETTVGVLICSDKVLHHEHQSEYYSTLTNDYHDTHALHNCFFRNPDLSIIGLPEFHHFDY
ncbi:hypothetical protein AC249_AIPGENE5167 [Exaiptasia diaphana]|nr:hypothetical protein AC249_AIPGENE5167 [Exaiptasia diaphana]